MRTLILLLLFACLFSTYAEAQAVQTITDPKSKKVSKRDSIKRASAEPFVFKDSARLAIEKMPKTAAVRSALLPGLGQIYNKRWWKVPVIYGGFVALGLSYQFNERYYKEFLGEVQYRLAHNNQPLNPAYAGYSYEGMVIVKDNYRRNRDLTIIGFVALDALNIIDAYVDAKFFRYDISNDLSLKFAPSFQKPPSYASQVYLIKLNFAL